MLGEIAAADYGFRSDEYLRDLRRIRDERRIPERPDDLPLEVLELIRWSEPDDPAWEPGGRGERGHLMRLFCCAVLLTAADRPGIRPYLDEEPTLRQCVSSAVALGTGASGALLPLLCWRVATIPVTDDARPFFAMAILLLAAAHYRQAADAPLLRELPRWVVVEERQARAAAQPPAPYHHTWLLGLKFSADGDDRWRELGWQLLVAPETPHPVEATTDLVAVGSRLVLGEPAGRGQDAP